MRLLEEVFRARRNLQRCLQLLDFAIAVLYILHLLQHLVALVLVLRQEQITVALQLQMLFLDDLELFLQVTEAVLGLLELGALFG